MVQLWMRWCRLCAREDSFNSHINLLLDEERVPLTHTIAQSFSIDINHFNNLPTMICTDCYSLIRTTVYLNQRIAKASSMFAELQVINEDEFDAHQIKVRHNLEYDFKTFTMSPLENTIEFVSKRTKLSEIDEQMIDQELMHCNKTTIIDLNPIKIKMEEEDRLDSNSGEDSSNGSTADCGSEKATTNQREDTQIGTKKKYKSRKERRADHNTKPHHCSVCHKGFLKLHNYRRHMHHYHNIKIDVMPPVFICENCGKEYPSISALRKHENSHTDKRTLKCKYCEKTFKDIHSLRLHEDTHNETTYICVICGLQLNTQRTLRMHMVVHSDQKKHKCDHCGNEFKRAKALKNHLILHTGLKPYSCDFCDRTFACGANCRSHKKKNHPVELAAHEAAGRKHNSKTRIPKLRELKAVTANKGEIGKLKNLTDHQEFNNEDANSSCLESKSGQNELSKTEFKVEVTRPNDMADYEKSSPSKEESADFFQGIFGKKYVHTES